MSTKQLYGSSIDFSRPNPRGAVRWPFPGPDSGAVEFIEEQRARIIGCTACTACRDAIQPVPGVGAANSGIVFVGRNPGRDEDIGGLPFIGRSGKVIDSFLEKVGLTREEIYLTNSVLCYTYKDRPPTDVELDTCTNLYLFPTLVKVKPYLVVTFGVEAAKAVSGFKALAKHHGKIYTHEAGFYHIPCYHPAAGMRSKEYKDALDFDAVQVKRFLDKRQAFIDKLLAKDV